MNSIKMDLSEFCFRRFHGWKEAGDRNHFGTLWRKNELYRNSIWNCFTGEKGQVTGIILVSFEQNERYRYFIANHFTSERGQVTGIITVIIGEIVTSFWLFSLRNLENKYGSKKSKFSFSLGDSSTFLIFFWFLCTFWTFSKSWKLSFRLHKEGATGIKLNKVKMCSFL